LAGYAGDANPLFFYFSNFHNGEFLPSHLKAPLFNPPLSPFEKGGSKKIPLCPPLRKGEVKKSPSLPL
jgi:hypothetical protein